MKYLLILFILLFFTHESAPNWTFKKVITNTYEMIEDMERGKND